MDPESNYAGDDVTMTCVSTGDSNPPVDGFKWFRDSVDDGQTVTQSRVVILTDISQSGGYSCQVQNGPLTSEESIKRTLSVRGE